MKVGKLKSTLADQQIAEQRVVAMDMEIRRISQEYGERTGEVNHLCGLLEALGKERDHLQMEVISYSLKTTAVDIHVGEDTLSYYFYVENSINNFLAFSEVF